MSVQSYPRDIQTFTVFNAEEYPPKEGQLFVDFGAIKVLRTVIRMPIFPINPTKKSLNCEEKTDNAPLSCF
ncbi:hypothetical protein HCUR_00981 [Holospora curviuscula]|uniref:Uncharacterized protein n=1 Tax=Holospora curviuscula TaxID=1082868 RepID=A0A2S5R898_9PROT|nr:hypothetical protein HCUR_00981 [Holospora curviuscula]